MLDGQTYTTRERADGSLAVFTNNEDGPRCSRCAFWQEDSDGHRGICRRSAPTVIVRTTLGRGAVGDLDDRELYGAWPLTDFADWCGEFVPTTNAGQREANGLP